MNLSSQLCLEPRSSRSRDPAVNSSLVFENIEDSDEGLLLPDPLGSPASALSLPIQPSSVEDRPMLSSLPPPPPVPSCPLGKRTVSAASCSSPVTCGDDLDPESQGCSYRPTTTNSFEVDFLGNQSPMDGDWRPMRPGYTLPPDLDYPSLQAVKLEAELENAADLESGLRQSIPIMPRSLAVFCFVLNVLWPGLGTMIAGLSVCCCSRPRSPYSSRSSVIWANLWVSFLQLLTTGLLLLGWIWSIAWGASFVNLSRQYRNAAGTTEHITEGHSDPTTATPGGAIVANSVPTTATSTAPPTISFLPPYHNPFNQPPFILLHGSPVIVRSPTTTHCSRTQGYQSAISPDVTSLAHRSRRRSWMVCPEMLLAPGALETIVVRNGTFIVQGSTGGNSRNGHQTSDTLTSVQFAPKPSVSRTVSHQ